jgi:hypothetical protein
LKKLNTSENKKLQALILTQNYIASLIAITSVPSLINISFDWLSFISSFYSNLFLSIPVFDPEPDIDCSLSGLKRR